jgi:hypothetical protein
MWFQHLLLTVFTAVGEKPNSRFSPLIPGTLAGCILIV